MTTCAIHLDDQETVISFKVTRGEEADVQLQMNSPIDHLTVKAADGAVHIIRKMDISRIVLSRVQTGR